MTKPFAVELSPINFPDQAIEMEAGTMIVPGQSIAGKTVLIDPQKVMACIAAARQAASGAYAPYSRFRVGAAAIMADDPAQTIITGVNVENASYGLTLCAERACLSAAASAGFRTIRYLAVSALDALDAPLSGRAPCGACRQAMQEFSGNTGTPEETLVFIDTACSDVLCEIFDMPRLLAHGFRFDGPRG